MALWKLCAAVLGGVLSSTMGYATSIDMNLIAHMYIDGQQQRILVVYDNNKKLL